VGLAVRVPPLRARRRQPVPERVDVQIFAPLPHQVEPIEHPARFKVWNWGRRAGKTRAAFYCAQLGHGPRDANGQPMWPGLAQGWDVVWLAPDFPQAALIWHEELAPRFQNLPGFRLNANEHTLTWPNGATLWVRSMQNVRSIRGIGKRLKGVVIEEAAHLDLEYAWKHVIRPTLMDNVGWAIIMSTPNAGLDGNQAQRTPSYFNLLCLRIQEGAAPPEWAYWHRTARDNPKILPSEFQALINEYAEKGEEIALQEEVYALLLTTGAGLAFPEWNAKVHVARYDPPPGAGYWVGGLDWGYATWGHFVMVWIGDGRRLVRREWRFSEMPPRKVGRRIAQLIQEWGLPWPAYIAAGADIFARRGRRTVAELIERGLASVARGQHAIPLVEVPTTESARAARKALLHEHLRYGPLRPDGTCPDWLMPLLQIHPDCTDLIRTIPRLPRDEKDSEKVRKAKAPTDVPDHPYDALTHALYGEEIPEERPRRRPLSPDIHPGFTRTGKVRRLDAPLQDDELVAQQYGRYPRFRPGPASAELDW